MLNLLSYQTTATIYESNRAIIYRGIRKKDQKPIILKMLTAEYPNSEELNRYQQEYEITHDLNLDGVIKAYALEKYQNSWVIILEDFAGESLKLIIANKSLTFKEFLPISIQIAEILGQIHVANIIHKDINPANILINPATGMVKITDFGIASLLPRENTTLQNPEQLEGTLAYISPEQTGRMNRSLDYRTDLYSLGATFYELLTGKLPFELTDALELVHCHIAKMPKSVHKINPNVPQIISDIVMKLMAKNAEERYQSAFGLKSDLEKCLENFENLPDFKFKLAQNDRVSKLQIPQKLYGRENEINVLLQAFERITQGVGEIILISGYSGVGKTALVYEVHKSITEKQGYFVTGKFNKFQHNVPYSGLTQVFNEFCSYLLTENTEVLIQWRERILQAIGQNGQILIDIIPKLELVIGLQPSVTEVGTIEAQNRFNLLFQNFFQAICQQKHPLVLFIDDLQWADSASLNLLNILLKDMNSQYFLIIGAYRDNEIDATYPLMTEVEKLYNIGVLINNINLNNLVLNDVDNIIADALRSKKTHTQKLSQLIYEKTQGNAFFTHEFLKSLYEQELLEFDLKNQTWQWDTDKIKELSITDNVVEFIARKLSKLPPQTQEVLKLASCIGNQFDLKTLTIIYQHSATETLTDLWQALEEGLLIPLDNNYNVEAQDIDTGFKFQHDRIQQATYSLISETYKARIHLQVGRLLQNNNENLADNLFKIIDHLNLGLELVKKQDERYEIANLNLLAGQKAKAATAYKAALNYLNQGVTLLPASSWEMEYELSFLLYLEQVEVLYLNTHFGQSQTLADTVLNHAKTLLDKVKLYELKIQAHITNTQMNEALDIGLQVLNLLDVELEQTPPIQESNVADLIDLPIMTDPNKLAAMRILMTIMSPAFIANPALLGSIAFTMVNLSLKDGNSPASSYGYGFYGLILCAGINDVETGYQFGKLSLELVDKLEAKNIKARTYELFHAFIRPWKEHPKYILDALYETVQIGLETGDIEYAAYSAIYCCTFPLLMGESLESVEGRCISQVEMLQKFQYEHTLNYIKIWRQLALNLQDKAAEKTLLTGEDFNEAEMQQYFLDTQNNTSLFALHVAKGILLCLLGESKFAVEAFESANQYQEGGTSFITGANSFYYSLALLAQYSKVSAKKQAKIMLQVESHQEKMKLWAFHAPMNYQHKYDLVEAEKARVLGQLEAIDWYEKAIAGAKENQYLQEEALAYELAAEYYFKRNMEQFGQIYLKKAHYGYQQWGAVAKTEDLEKNYSWLLEKNISPITLNNTNTTETVMASTRHANASMWLDLESMMKASQTLAGEIVLSRLLEKMMHIVIENAGAQHGFLILPDNNKWVIEAEGAVDKEVVTLLHSLAVEDHLPEAIISYVARTQENIVLADARTEGLYTENSYIKESQTQSVLCFPIIYQQQLRAILYLENNLTTGAFTEQRLNLLKMLSSQIAISLENAQWVATLDTKVADRTAQLNSKVEELTQARQELVQSEKMASLGRLVAGFAHELNTPLGVAVGSASALQQEAKKVNHLMAQEEIDIDELLSAIDTIDKGFDLTLSNLDRAANLVTSFKRTAVDQSSDEERVFLVKEVIDDIINTLHNRFKQTDISIKVICPNDIKIKSLPGALEQILTNFLMNSLIHGFNDGQEAGNINIAVQIDGINLRIEYADDGKGIDYENLEKIFEPFFTTHRAHGGSGLGMYICYNIVTTQLNGTLTCESTVGNGVLFKIYYPILAIDYSQ